MACVIVTMPLVSGCETDAHRTRTEGPLRDLFGRSA
jgi:hypothetical protein